IKRKSTPAAPIPHIDDAERDDLIEATQLSLAKAKTTKEYESQQNVSLVDDIILEENVEKLVEGDKESDGDDFVDTMILSDEDPDTRMGSSEVRTKKMQTPILSPFSSSRNGLSLDKAIAEELTVTDDHMLNAPSHAPSQPTSSTLIDSYRLDAFLKRDHDDHPDDDALPRGEKDLKTQRTSRGSKSTKGSSSKQPAKDSNTSA
nr:hypothetical protein [Tanacetum cinerariifolium]